MSTWLIGHTLVKAVTTPLALPVTGRGASVAQIACSVVRREVRAELLAAARHSGAGAGGAGGAGSVLFRVTAAVYALLAEHGVDRRGRCQRCRRPGSWMGPARQRCRVYPLVLDWLQTPATRLAVRLRRDLGVPIPSSTTPVPRPGLTIISRTPPTTTTEQSPLSGGGR